MSHIMSFFLMKKKKQDIPNTEYEEHVASNNTANITAVTLEKDAGSARTSKKKRVQMMNSKHNRRKIARLLQSLRRNKQLNDIKRFPTQEETSRYYI